MRASPPLVIDLRRFSWWRGAVLLLASLAVATVVAWAVAVAGQQQGPGLIAAVVGATLIAAGVAVQGAWLTSVPARLRWDGQYWQLLREGTGGAGPWAGDVDVALDLGAWMLLRFRAETAARDAPLSLWLPVQRRGLEAEWHELRCAVFTHRRKEIAP